MDIPLTPALTCPVMRRSFTALNLVQLPRTDSRGAIALASAVEAAAAADKELPESVSEIIAQIAEDRIALQLALAKGPAAGTLTVKEADRREDRVGGALLDILEGWASIAEFLPQGKSAKEVVDRVFPDGRSFVNMRVEEEWAAIETKLHTIENEGLVEKIAAIGALPVLDLLKQTHAVYGAVVGTTGVVDETREVRENKEALEDSLRTYVVRVEALVRRNKPETRARAEALVKPIREWESSKPSKAKAEGEPTPAPQPLAGSSDQI
ncbi:hypothetical protein [Polyangium aurulentum]|uniref:hypothetical protein n=1 Tax=Polyangium aurulentum TaxID=2567896 RepID=UPI0010AEBF94|nr:hypothetical protein [Polyangium aurulentum]UQA59378.1 hypothetical protein E8A73_002390 [Polyangium aurulentum]